MLSEEDFALFTRRRVGAFGRKLREACDDGAYDGMTFEDKVGMRVDAEIEARDSGKIGKAVGTARFRLKGACAEGIHCLPDRGITRGRMARPATRARIEARENLVTISEGGGGKSRIAQALGVAACRKPMPVRCARLSDMLREVNVARSEGRVYDAPDRFARPDPLILDGFFTTPVENPLDAADPFGILQAREGRGSTMSASQLGPDQWYPRVNSEPCADSMLSRAAEHARALDIKGPNMRECTASLKAESDKGYWD